MWFISSTDNIFAKPPIAPKPKLLNNAVVQGKRCDLDVKDVQGDVPQTPPSTNEVLEADEEEPPMADHADDHPTYPCICEHLEKNGRPGAAPDNDNDEVPTMSAVRTFWLKKSMEGADILMRYNVG